MTWQHSSKATVNVGASTPPGTYAITVTGTAPATSNSRSITANTTVTLVVETKP